MRRIVLTLPAQLSGSRPTRRELEIISTMSRGIMPDLTNAEVRYVYGAGTCADSALKDFFDPKLRKVHRTPRLTRAVEVTFEVRDFETRDFSAAA